MPPHKYYCDYCDKQFYDTLKSRKRHLQGVSHQRAKKQWFDSFRDEEFELKQDGKRQLCSFFLRTGTCQYGSECRFEHPVPPAPVPYGAPAGAGHHSPSDGGMIWAGANPPIPTVSNKSTAPEVALANFLMRDLPPSLRPPPEGGYLPQMFPVTWG